MSSYPCVLCTHPKTTLFHQGGNRSFFRCPNCSMIFVPASDHVSFEKEKIRYDQHQNSPDDQGYRDFLFRILSPLLPKLSPGSSGLDFGSGPSPVLAMILEEKGFEPDYYDPIYHNKSELLENQYDFVTCTEVVEHFRNPRTDWEQLTGLVKKGGWLAVMTQTTPENMAFGKWYYQRDETHVCFYSDQTFAWIAKQYQLNLEQEASGIVLFQR